jgi:hypothetical protein
MEKYRIEHFKSIYEFESALASRPVNKDFNIKYGSAKNDTEWTQTESYEEADSLLLNGWNKKIDELKGSLEKFSRKKGVQQRLTENNVVGFMPNVPRAIKGYPDSMLCHREINKTENKNTVHIIYSMGANGGTSGEQLLKAGLAVLKIAMILDKSNIRTKIDLVPFESYCGGDYIACTVGIKDYRQSFNFSKMAYPIANPSFFRRHGFRYLETLSGDLGKWSSGGYGGNTYGRDDTAEYMKQAGFAGDGIIYITDKDCKMANYDPMVLMNNKGIKIK